MLNADLIEKITQGKWLTPFPQNKKKILSGAAFDSRKITSEEIFFCWRGEKSDGHQYLNKLKNTSIQLAIVEKNISQNYGYGVLQVKNSLQALHQIAHYIAKNCKIPILALTGSNGKTTAKSWLVQLLSKKYKVLFNYKNFNNHIGCPLTLLNLKEENFILLEMGTSAKGEIQKLVEIIEPQYSMLLNVGLAHIANFDSIQNIQKEKMQIFSSKRLQAGFLSSSLLSEKREKKTYFYGKNTNYRCEIEKVDLLTQKTHCRVFFYKEEKKISFPVIAYHLKENIPMLLCIGDFFGIDFAEIIKAIKKIEPVAGRMEFFSYSKNRWIIDDSYNANPNSVIQLLKTMSLCSSNKKIAVIGFLAELEQDLKISSNYFLENIPSQIDKIYFTGKTGKKFAENLSQLKNVSFCEEKELLKKLPQEFQSDCLLAFKASRSAKLENFIADFKKLLL